MKHCLKSVGPDTHILYLESICKMNSHIDNPNLKNHLSTINMIKIFDT